MTHILHETSLDCNSTRASATVKRSIGCNFFSELYSFGLNLNPFGSGMMTAFCGIRISAENAICGNNSQETSQNYGLI